MKLKMIVAMTKNLGIGINNTIPWYCKEDLKRFSLLTKGSGKNAIIMGKNTFQSTGFLKHRHNLVLSSTLNLSDTIDSYQLESFSNIQKNKKYILNKSS